MSTQNIHSSEQASSRTSSRERTKVILRFRGPRAHESKDKCYENIVNIDEHQELCKLKCPQRVSVEAKHRVYSFDKVYGPEATQETIFRDTFKNLVDDVAQGFNSTVFAYGQTGTGKTYSMTGSPFHCETPFRVEKKGIIPRSIERLFEIAPENSIKISAVEIYNEQLRDLLSDDAKKLKVKETPSGSTCVKGADIVLVKTLSEALGLLAEADQRRSVGGTLLNPDSSRSHAIFTFVVECPPENFTGRKVKRVGKLNLVDLAGSERPNKSDAQGSSFKETTKINLSLSALVKVILSLVDRKNSFVPYRDSVLTRLLQDALGGNAKTIMLATATVASVSYEETLSTLRYASHVKRVWVTPLINVKLLKSEIPGGIIKKIDVFDSQTHEKIGKESEDIVEIIEPKIEKEEENISKQLIHLQDENRRLVEKCNDLKIIKDSKNFNHHREILEQKLIESENREKLLREELMQAETVKSDKEQEWQRQTKSYKRQIENLSAMVMELEKEVSQRQEQVQQLIEQHEAQKESELVKHLQFNLELVLDSNDQLRQDLVNTLASSNEKELELIQQKIDLEKTIEIKEKELKFKSLVIEHVVPIKQFEEIRDKTVWDGVERNWNFQKNCRLLQIS